MIINNKKDRVYIFTETGSTAEYTIYKLDTRGCLINASMISGALEDGYAEHKLKDGHYRITFYNEKEVDITQDFYVFYNGLPRFTANVLALICPCNNCPGMSKVDSKEVFFELIVYLQGVGLLCSQKGLKTVLSNSYAVLADREEYSNYYGKFVYDYDKAIYKAVVYAYVDLYNLAVDNLRMSEEDMEDINSAFNISVIERCLYSQGYDLEQINLELSNLNCGCNG